MFYSYELFGRKSGELGKIWLVGTVGHRKLSRAAVMRYNLVKLCQSILSSRDRLALPAQSTLLRGVVRVEEKQVWFLHADAIVTRNKITSSAQIEANVDLPHAVSKGSGIIAEPAEIDALLVPDQGNVLPPSQGDALLNQGIFENMLPGIFMEGGYPLDLSHLPSQSQHMAGMRDDAFIHDASMAWGQGLELGLDDLAIHGGIEGIEVDLGGRGGAGEDMMGYLEGAEGRGAAERREARISRAGLRGERMEDEEREMMMERAEEEARLNWNVPIEGLEGLEGKLPGEGVERPDMAGMVAEVKMPSAEEKAVATLRKRRHAEISKWVPDPSTELADAVIARQLADISDITIERPAKRHKPSTSKAVRADLNALGERVLAMPSVFSETVFPAAYTAAMLDSQRRTMQQAMTVGYVAMRGGVGVPGEDGLTVEERERREWLAGGEGIEGIGGIMPEDEMGIVPEGRRGLEAGSFMDVEMARGMSRDRSALGLSRLSFIDQMAHESVAEGLRPEGVGAGMGDESLQLSAGLIEQVALSQIEAPGVDVPLSQYELPTETTARTKRIQDRMSMEEAGRGGAVGAGPVPRVRTLQELGAVAAVFYGIVDGSLKRAVNRLGTGKRRVGEDEVEVPFVDALKEAASRQHRREVRRATTGVSESESESELSDREAEAARLSKRDVALSFAQLLALRSAGIIDAQQSTPYAPIYVSHGPHWRDATAPLPSASTPRNASSNR